MPMNFRKSSYCGASNTCVEVASTKNRVVIRDSKFPEMTPFNFSKSDAKSIFDVLKRR